jgi:hypothetical protein
VLHSQTPWLIAFTKKTREQLSFYHSDMVLQVMKVLSDEMGE